MKLQVSSLGLCCSQKGVVLSFSVVPLVASLSAYMSVLSVCTLQWASLNFGLFLGCYGLLLWVLEDQVKEGFSDIGLSATSSFKYGVLVFIFSEFMFFISILTSSFYLVAEGWVVDWVSVDFNMVPTLVSVVLLSSGVSLTIMHQNLMSGGKGGSVWLAVTVFLGLAFVFIQSYEWTENSFSFSSGVGGCVFYLITGFHGMHVVIGVLLNTSLLLMLITASSGVVSFVKSEVIIWYWHFVDVVWLFVYLGLYWYCM